MALKIIRKSLEPDNAHNVGSVRTFLEYLEKLQDDAEHVYFFRGHDDFTYKALPSIYRNQGWIKNEDILFKELILRCPNDFPGQQPTFQTLVKMQHYSLPTRLLDITANPLIALYFACQSNSFANSGEVIIYRVPKREIKYYDSDTVSVISNISRRPAGFSMPGEDDVEKFNNDDQIKLLLHEIRSEKPYFEAKILSSHLESVICVKPKMDNARIIRQDGAFFLFGISLTKLNPAKLPEKYTPPGNLPRLIVKADEKKKILKQLLSLGITQGTIYPEIQQVAEFIKTLYFDNGSEEA